MYIAAKTIALVAALFILLALGASFTQEDLAKPAAVFFMMAGAVMREIVLTLIPQDDPRDATFLDHP